MRQIVWTLNHEADIASDLSVFHRVDDPMTLDGPTYFERAVRLASYRGVMRDVVMSELHESKREQPSGGTGEPVEVVSDAVALSMLAADGWAEHVTEEEGALT